ncbi:MFS transporter [uncultured Kordia sp.]|uniref:MFS transporter n=1 Tax=uncultured Kordia sp. TaxID=507699 RepID=UPI002625CF75|nr:MFS transporter [uncultured Kordia sp.]
MQKASKFTIITLLLNSSLTIMVGAVIAPVLPSISKNLQFGFNSGLLVTLPSLGVILFSPIIGKLINKLGAFKLLMLGMLPYAFFGFIGVYLTNNYMLMLDRLFLGGACVAIQVSVTTLIAELFKGKERLKLIAWQGVAIELGGVIFLSLGGYLGEQKWSYPFYIYLIAILFFVFSWFTLPRTRLQQNVNDLTEIRKNSKDLFPIMLSSFFSMAIFFVCFISLPEYLLKKFNFSESSTGYLMSFISLIAVIVASQLVKISNYISSRNLVALGFLSFSLGYVLFATTSLSEIMYVGAIFIGIGFGFTIPILNHLTIEISTPLTRGKNLGYYSMMVFAGQFAATFIEFITNSEEINFLITSGIGIILSLVVYLLFIRTKNSIQHRV